MHLSSVKYREVFLCSQGQERVVGVIFLTSYCVISVSK